MNTVNVVFKGSMGLAAGTIVYFTQPLVESVVKEVYHSKGDPSAYIAASIVNVPIFFIDGLFARLAIEDNKIDYTGLNVLKNELWGAGVHTATFLLKETYNNLPATLSLLSNENTNQQASVVDVNDKSLLAEHNSTAVNHVE